MSRRFVNSQQAHEGRAHSSRGHFLPLSAPRPPCYRYQHCPVPASADLAPTCYLAHGRPTESMPPRSRPRHCGRFHAANIYPTRCGLCEPHYNFTNRIQLLCESHSKIGGTILLINMICGDY